MKLLNADTRVIVQGITGREGLVVARESLAYGAKVVAGVTPGRGGQTIDGIPVYDTVSEAVSLHGAQASVVVVPPSSFLDAVWEAADAGIGVIVGMTERVPRHDALKAIAIAKRAGAILVGPNSLGIIVPGKTRLGMAGGSAEATRRAYAPGPVAILSRSGGMTTELASMLTLNGIGQSICISIGGDPIVGSTYTDLLRILTSDDATRAVLIFGEPGTTMEEELAQYLMEHPYPLPVAAFIAGKFTDNLPGQRFGHAAALVEGELGRPAHKVRMLRAAGVLVADRLSEIPAILRTVLT